MAPDRRDPGRPQGHVQAQTNLSVKKGLRLLQAAGRSVPRRRWLRAGAEVRWDRGRRDGRGRLPACRRGAQTGCFLASTPGDVRQFGKLRMLDGKTGPRRAKKPLMVTKPVLRM